MPAPAAPQLDLFEHSQDTMLRNDVLDALLRRDAAAAAAALSALAGVAPRHDALAPLAVLIAALAAEADTAPWAAPGAAALAATQLADPVTPAAQAQLGTPAAARWLAPLWRQLAQRAARLPFRAAQPADHAAPLWLRVGDAAAAQAATQAVAGIESWWRLPAPLAWMAQARHATDGLDATWPLLAELAWLAGPRLGATAGALNDPLLKRLLRRFEDEFDPAAPDPSARNRAEEGMADKDMADRDDNLAGSLAWFPAWLLTEQPALLPRLREARRGQDRAPERAFWQLVELLGLERQARHAELMAGRQRLRDAQPALYAAYMKSR
jgi:hypothetical protein